MKKLIPFILLLLSISHLAYAQLKLYVYEHNGETTEFVASNVDSIAFSAPGTYPINPNNDDSDEEFVDMGLSVRWATCNVGANSPEEYGDYFAWGEIGVKQYYDIDNYIWCNGKPGTITKYCTDETAGSPDYNIHLDASDDAARVILGDRWRMPTLDEFKELIDNSSINWTKLNGVNGYELTSIINGNSIFIPAAGCMYYSEMSNGEFGYYWTSTLDLTDSNRAMQFGFNNSNYKLSGSTRYYGQPVRPVMP